MNYKIVVVLLLIIGTLLGFFAGLGIGGVVLTGEVVKENDYSWTTAICDKNVCLDVLIHCKNGGIVDIRPVSGFVRHDFEWLDGRNVSIYCA